jgi:hypothetical protein
VTKATTIYLADVKKGRAVFLMVLTIKGRTILIVEEGRAPIFLLLLLLADEEIYCELFAIAKKNCTAGTYVEF